jgi:transcriptional regulator of acetoin/glycerol metabolism
MAPAKAKRAWPRIASLTDVDLVALVEALAREAERRRDLLEQARLQAQAVVSGVVFKRNTARPAPTKEELAALMAKCAGNMLRAARMLGRKPTLIYRWAKRYGLAASDYRPRVEPWDPRAKHRPWMVTKPREGGA